MPAFVRIDNKIYIEKDWRRKLFILIEPKIKFAITFNFAEQINSEHNELLEPESVRVNNVVAIPLSLLLHFIPLSLSLLCLPIWAALHHLYMYMVAFLALRILYVVALVCFCFSSLVFSPSESLPGKDVLCRLLPRPLPSVCFLFFSFLFRPCSPPICFGVTSSIL